MPNSKGPGRLRYDVVRAAHLGVGDLDSWRQIATGDPILSSPFFQPDYTLGVAAVRDGVEVCRIRDGERLVGVYPFERLPDGVARPVGGALSNYQAVVAERGVAWSARELATAAGVRQLQFHHQIAEQREFEPFARKLALSPVMDFADGLEAYLRARRDAGVTEFKAIPRKTRRLEQEIGPLRFTVHSTDAADFDALVAWKCAQYTRTGTRGSLQLAWGVAAVKRMLAVQSPGFAGMLSCLYAGDRLIAVHAGMRSATELHYWFPAYDLEVARYSPGQLILLRVAEWAIASGITRIDLGKGDEQYKSWFATGHRRLLVGQVSVPRVRLFVARAARMVRRLVRRKS